MLPRFSHNKFLEAGKEFQGAAIIERQKHPALTASSQAESSKEAEKRENMERTESKKTAKAATSTPKTYKKDQPVDVEDLKSLSQAEQKIWVAKAFSDAPVWIADENWAFNVKEIPTSHNLEDVTVGQLYMLFKDKTLQRTQIQQFRLVFTGAGTIRKDRPNFGRPFLDMQGNVASNGNGYYFYGTENGGKKGTSIDMIIIDPGYQKFKLEVLNHKPPSLLSSTSPEKPEVPSDLRGKKRERSPGDARTEGKSFREFTMNVALPGLLPDPKEQQDNTEIDFLQNAILERDQELAKERLKAAVVEQALFKEKRDRKAAEAKVEQVKEARDILTSVSEELIETTAESGTDIIRNLIFSAVDRADFFEGKWPGSGDFYLSYYKNTLTQALDDIEERRGHLLQIEAAHLNPDSEEAWIGRARPISNIKKRKEGACEKVVEEVNSRRLQLLEKQTEDIRKTTVKAEEEKIRQEAETAFLEAFRDDENAEDPSYGGNLLPKFACLFKVPN